MARRALRPAQPLSDLTLFSGRGRGCYKRAGPAIGAGRSPVDQINERRRVPFDLTHYGIGILAICAVALFAGGTVKGTIGVGMPLVAVPIIASVLDPKIAISLMVVPVTTTNVWLVYKSGTLGDVLRRFWTLIVMLLVFTWIGAQLLAGIDAGTVSLLLGIVVILFCVTQVLPVKATVPPRAERWLNPGVGTVSGLMGGISNFFGPPLIIYLTALRLPKDVFVPTIAVFFLVSSLPFYGSLVYHDILTWQVAVGSAIAAVVATIGVSFGGILRKRVSQEMFEKILLIALVVIGINLIRRGIS
jgi:uncharacterized membrane protein YfcA